MPCDTLRLCRNLCRRPIGSQTFAIDEYLLIGRRANVFPKELRVFFPGADCSQMLAVPLTRAHQAEYQPRTVWLVLGCSLPPGRCGKRLIPAFRRISQPLQLLALGAPQAPALLLDPPLELSSIRQEE